MIETQFAPIADQLVDEGGLVAEYLEYFGKAAGKKALGSDSCRVDKDTPR